MIQVAIVDDHTLIRSAIRRMIDATQKMTVTAEASSAEEALRVLRKEKWSVLLLDISLPGKSGINLLESVVAMRPDAAIIVLSQYEPAQYAVRSIRTGAKAYLNKNVPAEVLLEAIETVAQGLQYITPEVGTILAREVFEPTAKVAAHDNLSNREHEVFVRTAKGMKNKDIASELSLTVSTVETYKRRIVEKLGLESTHSIVAYAYQCGVLKANP